MVTIKTQKKHTKLYGKEYEHISRLRIVYMVVLSFLFGSIGFLIFFVHTNVYQALEVTNTIVLLRSEIGIETIDFHRLSETQTKWNEKKDAFITSTPRNPFIEEILPPVEVSTTTQPISTSTLPTSTTTIDTEPPLPVESPQQQETTIVPVP